MSRVFYIEKYLRQLIQTVDVFHTIDLFETNIDEGCYSDSEIEVKNMSVAGSPATESRTRKFLRISLCFSL